MKTYKLKKNDLKNINEESQLRFEGHLKVEGNLGHIKLRSLVVYGDTFIGEGTFIDVVESIASGYSIFAKETIKAGLDIEAGWRIESRGGLEAGNRIKGGGPVSSVLQIKCRILSAEGRLVEINDKSLNYE
jgi:hypothetical protein